ncbi:OLC1v1008462C1 [Oldenlandia corymbosa var. corymbosa]|uniref:OLC1v1008462C1 n=1 Tax=Oldenlandia corymbosa var. corymbosa TaxID=529605 RepID=A0AAV1DPH1_OLDCO|nr:OLC1v1008462C1 [Oldenlandia corymbosa var. corymbosa]
MDQVLEEICANLSLNKAKKVPLAETVGRSPGTGFQSYGCKQKYGVLQIQFYSRSTKSSTGISMDDRQLFVLTEVNEDDVNDQVDFSWVPFWIRIRGLPYSLMNKDATVSIGNMIGQFVESECDQDGLAIRACLRAQVSIDITKALCQYVEGVVRWKL